MNILRKNEYKPTKESIERSKKIHELCKLYGIPVGIFDGEKCYTEDEANALEYIINDKDIPSDLAERLLKEKKNKVHSINNKNNTEIDDELDIDVPNINFELKLGFNKE